MLHQSRQNYLNLKLMPGSTSIILPGVMDPLTVASCTFRV